MLVIVDTVQKKENISKEKKFPFKQAIHCVVIPLTGQVPAVRLLSASWPLDFMLHYEDIA